MTDDEQQLDADTHLFAGLAIFVGVLLLVFSVPAIPRAARIGFDLSTPGTYVVGDVPQCRGSRCYSHSGTFTSDNGKVTRTGVHVRNWKLGMKQGDRIRAFDVGDASEVFTHEGEGGYPVPLPFLFGLVGLVALGLGLQHSWVNRRRGRQSG